MLTNFDQISVLKSRVIDLQRSVDGYAKTCNAWKEHAFSLDKEREELTDQLNRMESRAAYAERQIDVLHRQVDELIEDRLYWQSQSNGFERRALLAEARADEAEWNLERAGEEPRMSANPIREQIADALVLGNGIVFVTSPLDVADAILAAVPLIAALDHALEGWRDDYRTDYWAVYHNQFDGEYSFPDENRVLVIPAPKEA